MVTIEDHIDIDADEMKVGTMTPMLMLMMTTKLIS